MPPKVQPADDELINNRDIESEPDKNQLAVALDQAFRRTPAQHYLNWLCYIQVRSTSIALNISDLIVTTWTLVAGWLGLLSGMPYAKPSGEIAGPAGAYRTASVTSSVDLNAILNTFGIKSGFDSFFGMMGNMFENLFCSQRPNAEMNFEYKKTFRYYSSHFLQSTFSALIIAIVAFLANLPALTVAFKEKKEIVIPETDSGLFPNFMAAFLNSLDFGSADVQMVAIFVANYFLMLISVIEMYNSIMSSSFVERITKPKDPTEYALRQVKAHTEQMTEAVKRAIMEIEDIVFFEQQFGLSKASKEYLAALRSKAPTQLGVIETRLKMAAIFDPNKQLPTQRFQPISKWQEFIVIATTWGLFSWQSYLMLPAKSMIDPSSSPINPPVDPTPQQPAEQHPILLPFLFYTIMITQIIFFLRAIVQGLNYKLPKLYNTKVDDTEDRVRNVLISCFRLMALYGTVSIIVGTREMATWTLDKLGVPVKANDFQSYFFGILFAVPFAYLGFMAARGAAITVSNYIINVRRHYRDFQASLEELGEERSFGQYLKMVFTHPSEFLKMVRFPKIFVLHPFTAPILMLLTIGLGPFSSATVRKLNEEQFGSDVANYLLSVHAVVVIALLNLLGVPKSYSQIFRFGTRVALQIYDAALFCYHSANDHVPSIIDETDKKGFAKVLDYFSYQSTRDLYAMLTFHEAMIAGYNRMDAMNLYINVLATALPTHLAAMQDTQDERNHFQTNVLSRLAHIHEKTIADIMNGLSVMLQTPLEEAELEKLLQFYFIHLRPNQVLSDPKFSDVKTFSAMIGRSYCMLSNVLGSPSQARSHSSSSGFWANNVVPVGQYGSVSHSANEGRFRINDNSEDAPLLGNRVRN